MEQVNVVKNDNRKSDEHDEIFFNIFYGLAFGNICKNFKVDLPASRASDRLNSINLWS